MSKNIQDETMDNQQERPTEAELGWLAGILDGEGSLAISINSTHRSIYPVITVTSVGREIIDKCEVIAIKMGAEYTVKHEIPHKGRELTPHSLFRIATARRLKYFLPIIQPYLTVKKPHARIILEFCDSRLSLPYGYPYTEKELQLFYEIRKYQIKKGKTAKGGIPNDYTPGWRPRYKKHTSRNVKYRKSKNINLPEDIV